MEAITLRHDNLEGALPHQVDLPESWGIKLLDPIPFEVTLPKWCPVDNDALVALHWWASLCAHLHALLTMVESQQKVQYQLDKAMRHEIQVVRDIYGTSVSAAIAAAGSLARDNAGYGEEAELGCWSMAIQTAFGLLCVRAAAKGTKDPIVAEMLSINEWIGTALLNRLGNANAWATLMTPFTGTPWGAGGLEAALAYKLDEWRKALAKAAEGAPEGVPGVAEALDCRNENESVECVSEMSREAGLAPGSDRTGVDKTEEL